MKTPNTGVERFTEWDIPRAKRAKDAKFGKQVFSLRPLRSLREII
jgi:hypothetical protein